MPHPAKGFITEPGGDTNTGCSEDPLCFKSISRTERVKELQPVKIHPGGFRIDPCREGPARGVVSFFKISDKTGTVNHKDLSRQTGPYLLAGDGRSTGIHHSDCFVLFP